MRDLLVLCYHAISERWPAALANTPEQLRSQLELLVRHGYRGATFTEAVRARPAGRTVVVTFDDAYRSVIDAAFPILRSLELPGTVFAVTDFADRGERLSWPGIAHWDAGPHAGELEGMTWAQLNDLAREGWEVGSHTRTHPRLTELDDAALIAELRMSREACEHGLGRPCRSLAYPYGAVSPRVVEAARTAGYEAAAALPARLHRSTALEWPRVGVYRPDSLRRFRLKVSPTVRYARRAARGLALPRRA